MANAATIEMPPNAMPTPTRAVSSGIPAASSEPNVMMSTTPAKSTPKHLGDREAEARVLEDLAAERDTQAGVFADRAGRGRRASIDSHR